MKFYTKTHPFYCGVDLHTKTQYLCILDQNGNIVLHQNLPNKPQAFLKAIQPFRDNLVVGIECIFSWYWREQVHNWTPYEPDFLKRHNPG